MGSVCCKRLEHPSSPRLPLGKFITRITDALCPQDYGREAEAPRTRKFNSLDISGPLPLTNLNGWKDTALVAVDTTPKPPPRRRKKKKDQMADRNRSNSLAVVDGDIQERRRTRSLEEVDPDDIFPGLFRYDSNDHLEALDFQLYALPRLPRRSSSLSEITIPIHKALPLSKSTGSLKSEGAPPFILEPPPPPRKKSNTKAEFLNNILKEGEATVGQLDPIRENPKEINNNCLTPEDKGKATEDASKESPKEEIESPETEVLKKPESVEQTDTSPTLPQIPKALETSTPKETEIPKPPETPQTPSIFPKEKEVKQYQPVMFSEAEIISTLEKIRSNRLPNRNIEGSYHVIYSSPKPYEPPKSNLEVKPVSDHSRNPSMTESLKEFETSIYDMLQETQDGSDEDDVIQINESLKVQIKA